MASFSERYVSMRWSWVGFTWVHDLPARDIEGERPADFNQDASMQTDSEAGGSLDIKYCTWHTCNPLELRGAAEPVEPDSPSEIR
jgi:hypothetical protein